MENFTVIINRFQSSTIIANFLMMKIVPVKNSQHIYFKQNLYYKDLSQWIFRPVSGYFLELNFRVTFSLEILEIDLQFFSEYSGRLL